MENLGRYCRGESGFPQRLRELSVLICARHFDSQSAWNTHIQQAVEEGVPADCLDRLARGEDPDFKAEDERVFHAFAHEMLYDHFVTDETYAAALSLFDEEGVLDLIGCIGSFSMSAMMLYTFQVRLRPRPPRPFTGVDGFRRSRTGRIWPDAAFPLQLLEGLFDQENTRTAAHRFVLGGAFGAEPAEASAERLATSPTQAAC
ncbi:carboxymuconolactone decarboxylase family protein [Streptomyces sp. A30]|uniref:carboxymuconolactone decarboxylase family protein n=1 Tax=Streptomyces sp. A30 TaxID=2789273 RepID=UPI0039818D3E